MPGRKLTAATTNSSETEATTWRPGCLVTAASLCICFPRSGCGSRRRLRTWHGKATQMSLLGCVPRKEPPQGEMHHLQRGWDAGMRSGSPESPLKGLHPECCPFGE